MEAGELGPSLLAAFARMPDAGELLGVATLLLLLALGAGVGLVLKG